MKRAKKIIAIALIIILLTVGVALWWLQTESGQDFITRQTVTYLRSKTHTQLNIDRVRFRIPDWLSVEGVFIADQQGDTLMAGEKLHVDLDMPGLLRGRIGINSVALEGIRLKVNRTLPDTTFNFQFIADAFTGTEPEPGAPSEPMQMRLDDISLKRVHVTYVDDVTGISTDAYIAAGNTRFARFNPSYNQYHPTLINLAGSDIRLRMYEGIPTPETTSAASDTLDLKLGKISLSNINWHFADETSGLTNGVRLGRFAAEIDQTYLDGQRINIRSIDLSQTSAFVEFAKTGDKNAQPAPADTTSAGSWTVKVGKLSLTDNEIRYDDHQAVPVKKGMDYGHLHFSDLRVGLSDFIYSADRIEGKISEGAFREKSGLVLRELHTDFAYSSTQTYLKNLLLKTPGTQLADELSLSYRNRDELFDDTGKVKVNLSLKNSRLAFADVLTLMPDLSATPPFSKNPGGYLAGEASITGTVDRLSIRQASFSMLDGTRLKVTGTIAGLPDADKLSADLQILELASSRSDLLKLLPDSLVPASLEIPEQLTFSGKIAGSLSDLNLDTRLSTTLGDATLTGHFRDITDSTKAAYTGSLHLRDFDMGKLLRRPPEELGALTFTADFDGRGLDPKTMQARLNGVVNSADIRNYTYENLTLEGAVNAGKADLNAFIRDPNADLSLTAAADLSKDPPSVVLETRISELNLNALHLYTDSLRIKGHLSTRLTSADPEKPAGDLNISGLTLTNHGKSYTLDSLRVNLVPGENGSQQAVVESPFLKAELSGRFSYLKLADIVVGEINKYFRISDSAVAGVKDPYSIALNGNFRWHPVLQAFVPALTQLEPVSFTGRVSNQADTTLHFTVHAPLVEYDSTKISNTSLSLTGNGQKADLTAALGEASTGSFRIRKAFLTGDLRDDRFLFDFQVRDSLDTERHALSGQLRREDKNYVFNLRKNLRMDYRNWRTDSTGKITYGPDGLLVSDFGIRRGRSQKLNIHSITGEPNGPIRIEADSIAIGPFVTLFTMDSTLAKGRLDAGIEVSNYMDSPSFAGDLTIKNLVVTQIPVGDLQVNATNKDAGRIHLDAQLHDASNDLRLKGDYVSDAKNPFDFSLDVNRLHAKTIEAFSFGQLRNAKGTLTGRTTIRGNTTNPLLNGSMKFDSVAFNVSMLGARYRINDSGLTFENENLIFRNFILNDTLNNKLTLDGTVKLVNVPDVSYDLRINTDKFYVLDASRKDNDYFYGKGVVQARLHVSGAGANSVVLGNVKLLGESNISVLIPDNSAGAANTEGVVEFIDMDNLQPAQQAAGTDETKVLSTSIASELSLNLETDENAQFTIVVDELNGDNLKVKGNAQLNVGVAPNGEIFILGAYNLDQGTYDLTFQVLKKQFQIKKGSSMIWTGDPLNAELNITAAYRVSADPTPIDPGQTRSYGKVPLDVELKIGGTINNLKITFGIAPAETADEGIKNLLKENRVFENLANNEAELNKQVFALLVLNKFMTDQSGAASMEGFSAEAMARQSVSKLLTEQLNMLASDLIKGVDLDLNLNSTADMASGSRTDLNVGLSKAFLDDRLTVSVGRNFELENTAKSAQSTEIFDNIAVNYALTKDGRYKVRAYRKNQYQAVLEGFIVETGLSFVMTFDYDLFKEIFKK